MVRISILMLLALLHPAAVGGQEDRHATPSPALDPTQAVLDRADGDLMVWQVSHVVEGTERHVAPRFDVRYFLQRWGDDHAVAVHHHRSTRWPRTMAILDDGTVLLTLHGRWIIAGPDREAEQANLAHDDQAYQLVAAWPDALLVQPAILNTEQPVSFVPLRNARPDFDRRVQVTEAIRVNLPPRFVRSGDVIAWTRREPTDTHRPRHRAWLHTFHLRTHEATEQPLPEPVMNAEAIDGGWLLAGAHAFELETGRSIRHRIPSGRVHFRDGVLYHVPRDTEHWQIMALDMRDDSPTSRVLATIDKFPLMTSGGRQLDPHTRSDASNARNLFAQSIIPAEDGLRYWDGNVWQTIPYVD